MQSRDTFWNSLPAAGLVSSRVRYKPCTESRMFQGTASFTPFCYCSCYKKHSDFVQPARQLECRGRSSYSRRICNVNCTRGSLVPVRTQPHAPRRRVWDLEPVASVAGRSGEASIVYGYGCGSETVEEARPACGVRQGPSDERLLLSRSVATATRQVPSRRAGLRLWLRRLRQYQVRLKSTYLGRRR